MSNRRNFLQHALGLGASLFAAPRLFGEAQPARRTTKSFSPVFNTPVITTDVGDLPFTLEDGVKVFRLTAHVMQREIAPNKTIDVWGFNGSAPGPTIQVTQGDRVRVIVKNELPEPTSMHWHGFEDLIATDGMPGISQEPILPGESYTYNFTIRQEGTYFYHSHMAMQELAGMLGAFIMHPKEPYRPHCDKDFVVHLQEFAVLPNNTTPNTTMMEFNWLLLNGKAGPASTPLIVRQGDRVRVRFVNLGMDHHPMHLHGHTFHVTGTEGGRIPETAWWPGNTVLVGVAQARNIEFIANNPGDWMLHCHLPHHMMNQMSSQAGDMTITNGPISNKELEASIKGMTTQMSTGNPTISDPQMRGMMAMDMSADAMKQQMKGTAPNAGDVPNFPQDNYMEGPMMGMDALVDKPENFGLRPGWSRFMQGMMTFVRVLPPEKYDAVIAQMNQANRLDDPYASLLNQA